MSSLLVCFVIILLSFIATYFSKRRFGVLGLALAAGYILSDIWQYDAGLLASFLSIPSGFMTTMIISVIITLLPPAILMFAGNTYKKQYSRVLGSILFSLLVLAFLVEPLSRAMLPVGFGSFAYIWLIDNRLILIGGGLVLAIVDIMLTKKPLELSKKRH